MADTRFPSIPRSDGSSSSPAANPQVKRIIGVSDPYTPSCPRDDVGAVPIDRLCNRLFRLKGVRGPWRIECAVGHELSFRPASQPVVDGVHEPLGVVDRGVGFFYGHLHRGIVRLVPPVEERPEKAAGRLFEPSLSD